MATFGGGCMSAIRFEWRNTPFNSLDTDVRSYTPQKRDGDKRITKNRLVKLLVASGYYTLSEKVTACNSEYFALACNNGHVAQRLPTSRCRSRLCPYCAPERQQRAQAKLCSVILRCLKEEPNDRIVLVTLTVRNSFDSLRMLDKAFKAAFGRLRRMKNWRSRVAGAVCVYEFNLTPTGWHYHAHILAVCADWYDQADLSNDWRCATRDVGGGIVDIRSVPPTLHALSGVLHYCFKPPNLEKFLMLAVLSCSATRCFTLRVVCPTLSIPA